MAAETTTQARTYGGWRRSRSMGLFGLGPAATLLLLGVLALATITASVQPRLFAILVVPSAIVIAAMVVRVGGVPIAGRLARRARWWAGSLRGHTAYRSGVMVAGPHAWNLPGVLAATRLLHVDGPGGGYGVVQHERLGTMTVTLRCAATTTWLTDPAEADGWVANWASWLASLGHQPTVTQVAVTVDTAPDPGTRLSDQLARRILPHAPASAQMVLRQLIDTAPASAADVDTRVTITFRPAAAPVTPRNVSEAVAEIGRTLPGLQTSLSGCGLAVVGRASAADLIGIVRTAYDPAVRGDVARLLATRRDADWGRFLDWDTAGPVAADEHYDHYRHDSGVSVSWAWHEAPRQQVHSDVLARLLAPGPYPKRVTLLYRPLPAGEAARVVEREVNAAAFRTAYHRAQRRDESARDHTDRERALRAAREEAVGAGVGYMSLFVTVTVLDPDQLPRAVADVEARADAARIRLRRAYGSQSAAFAVTLPAGLMPPALSHAWPH